MGRKSMSERFQDEQRKAKAKPKAKATKAAPKAKAKLKAKAKRLPAKPEPKPEPKKAQRIKPEPEQQKAQPEQQKAIENNWENAQELLDNARTPSDLVVKAVLLKQFTDEEIAQLVKDKFGDCGYPATKTYVSDLRSQTNRQAYFKGLLEEATAVLGDRLPIPKFVRDEKGNLVAKLWGAAKK